jgi:hypothetical protein
MKLNRNSISARLYRWFYMTSQMPQSLCPYFWKLVFMWILLIPVAIISIPSSVIVKKPTEWAVRLATGILGWAGIILIIVMISPFTYFIWGWVSNQTLLGAWQESGIILWAGAALVACVAGILYLIERIKEKRRQATREFIWSSTEEDWIKNPNFTPKKIKERIIIEFIKATYHKYCPKIDWENHAE